MIRDYQESFLTETTAVEELGGHASGVSDYRDTGQAGAYDDAHRKTFLNIAGLSDVTTSDGGTLTIILESHDDVAFSGPTTEWSSGALAATAIEGLEYHVPLPEGMLRYIRIKWTIAGTCTDGGHFEAFLSNS